MSNAVLAVVVFLIGVELVGQDAYYLDLQTVLETYQQKAEPLRLGS
jgi:hypothetical protein